MVHCLRIYVPHQDDGTHLAAGSSKLAIRRLRTRSLSAQHQDLREIEFHAGTLASEAVRALDAQDRARVGRSLQLALCLLPMISMLTD